MYNNAVDDCITCLLCPTFPTCLRYLRALVSCMPYELYVLSVPYVSPCPPTLHALCLLPALHVITLHFQAPRTSKAHKLREHVRREGTKGT